MGISPVYPIFTSTCFVIALGLLLVGIFAWRDRVAWQRANPHRRHVRGYAPSVAAVGLPLLLGSLFLVASLIVGFALVPLP